MAKCAFIIGGTGQIGRAVASELLGQGWQVTIAARGNHSGPEDLLRQGAVFVGVDREDPGALRKAIGGGTDAVIDTIAYDEGHARQLLGIEEDVGAFVVISSASVYRDRDGRTLDEAGETGFPELPEPISETQPTVAPGPATYSTRKVALERTLLDNAKRPVTILRPCAIHGTHSNHPREWWFVKRMLDGRSFIPLAYQGKSRFHTSAVANIAALAATALKHSGGGILNAADPEVLSVAEIGALIADHMHYDGQIIGLDANAPVNVGRSPWSIPRPFILDMQSAGALGYMPRTTYRQAIGPLCDWLARQGRGAWEAAFPVLASYPWPLFDYATEDKVGPLRATPSNNRPSRMLWGLLSPPLVTQRGAGAV